ncbi:MAG: hypothetical protein Q8L78_01860 [Coxiellaceae bacterium]|nr:hypothetical protein [Coxiellaceae bacterium]
MRNVSQKTLVDKFIAYINITRKRAFEKLVLEREALSSQKPLDEKALSRISQIAQLLQKHTSLTQQEESNYRKGLCHGFSIMHAYMNATEKLDAWKNTLKIMSEWDGMEDSLAHEAANETYDRLFQQRINDVLFSQQGSVTNVEQTDFLTPNGLFRSENDETIKAESRVVAAGYFSNKHLLAFLNEAVFSSKAICLIKSGGHACSIRYDSNQQKWFFYDPNNNDGETEYSDKLSLIKRIKKTLGNSLCLEVASWNSTEAEKIQLLRKAYLEIVTTDSAEIVQEFGLYFIARNNPEQLTAIIEKAKQDENLCLAIAKALVFEQYENEDEEASIFLNLQDNFPEQYQQIVQLAQSSEAIAQALYFNQLYKSSDLHRKIFRDFVVDNKFPALQVFYVIKGLSENTLKTLDYFYNKAENKQDFAKHFIEVMSFNLDQLQKKIDNLDASTTIECVKAIVTVIHINKLLLTAGEKKELFGKLNERIVCYQPNENFQVIQKKIAIFECIEAYLDSRVEKTVFEISTQIKTKGVGFFDMEGVKEITEEKVKAAVQLKTAILCCEDLQSMEAAIQSSKAENKKISGWFHRGKYSDCLNDCSALLVDKVKSAVPSV